MKTEELIKALTPEEKAALAAGTNFMYTYAPAGRGIPSLRMSDGPHGLRVQTEGGDNGITASLPATAFPTAATVAAGWDLSLSRRIGAAIGREAHRYGVHVVLGPGVNIKRNPTAGRNFEYFSEDPCLAGKMAAAEVEGIQGEGVGVSVKHFALNNSENYRFTGDSIADMRAIREIYFKVFEIVVKESHPAAVMCAYNKINGEYCSQNRWLLKDVLRGEWGFDGPVMTDWGATHDRVAGIKAGLDLEMPGDTAICRKWIAEGLADGTLPEADLDAAVANVLALIERYAKPHADDCDFVANDALACEAAEASAVLLKNDGALPLDKTERWLVCGDLFEKMRYQGAGSSMINPTCLTSPRKAFDDMGIRYEFVRGYAENAVQPDREAIASVVVRAAAYESVLVFAGLTDYTESEGGDREDMRLPQNQLALIEALIAAGKRVIVVLFGGSPVELPFVEGAAAILNMYLPGQSGGRACARLLFGDVSPSGRLAETWPLRYEDVPFGREFGKTANEVYKESVFVGYRYYATAGVPVRYPFGYGLSYTRFGYSDCKIVRSGGTIAVGCTVTNVGGRRGAEVVQAYVGLKHSAVFRPLRELKAFRKVTLDPGQSTRVELEIGVDELAFFHPKAGQWQVEGGEYTVSLCRDALTPVYEAAVAVEGVGAEGVYDDAINAIYARCDFSAVTDEVFTRMSGQHIPALPPGKPITTESRFSALKEAGVMGRLLYAAVLGVANRQMKAAKKLPEGPERDNRIKGAIFLKKILNSSSLISMTMAAGKACPYNVILGFMELANGHLFRGLKCFCSKIKAPELPGQ